MGPSRSHSLSPDFERRAGADGSPFDSENPAGRGVVERYGDLLDRLRGLADLHRYASDLERRLVWNAPLPRLLEFADQELPLLVARNGVDLVRRPRREPDRPERERLVARDRRRLVRAGPPWLAAGTTY